MPTSHVETLKVLCEHAQPSTMLKLMTHIVNEKYGDETIAKCLPSVYRRAGVAETENKELTPKDILGAENATNAEVMIKYSNAKFTSILEFSLLTLQPIWNISELISWSKILLNTGLYTEALEYYNAFTKIMDTHISSFPEQITNTALYHISENYSSESLNKNDLKQLICSINKQNKKVYTLPDFTTVTNSEGKEVHKETSIIGDQPSEDMLFFHIDKLVSQYKNKQDIDFDVSILLHSGAREAAALKLVDILMRRNWSKALVGISMESTLLSKYYDSVLVSLIITTFVNGPLKPMHPQIMKFFLSETPMLYLVKKFPELSHYVSLMAILGCRSGRFIDTLKFNSNPITDAYESIFCTGDFIDLSDILDEVHNIISLDPLLHCQSNYIRALIVGRLLEPLTRLYGSIKLEKLYKITGISKEDFISITIPNLPIKLAVRFTCDEICSTALNPNQEERLLTTITTAGSTLQVLEAHKSSNIIHKIQEA